MANSRINSGTLSFRLKRNAGYRQKFEIDDSLDQILSDISTYPLEGIESLYLDIFNECNGGMIPYLREDQKKKLFLHLLYAYICLSKTLNEQLVLKRYVDLDKLRKDRHDCAQLLFQLNQNIDISKAVLSEDALSKINNEDSFSYQLKKIKKGKTQFIKKVMGLINERRLYWVWGGGLLAEVLNRFPNDFYYAGQAKVSTAAPSPYLCHLGWGLYYARFLIEFSLLLKHTINGPWMTKQEAKTPWTQRFSKQWDQRKFTLINDSIWATANLICDFWWVGSGVKGHAGNLLTIGLLLMDLSISIWRFFEEKAKYESELKALQDLRDRYQRKRKSTDEINKAIKKCEREWHYLKISLLNDIAYAAALLLAFSLMTVPFLPIATSLAMTLGLVGIATCFALTVLYSAVDAGIGIAKTLNDKKGLAVQIKAIENESNRETDLNGLRQLHLRRLDLLALDHYHDKMLRYQSLSLTRSVLIDATMPALVFASMVFLPMGTGIALLAVSLGIALLSKFVLEKYAKPKEPKKSEFNQNQFRLFSQDKQRGCSLIIDDSVPRRQLEQ